MAEKCLLYVEVIATQQIYRKSYLTVIQRGADEVAEIRRPCHSAILSHCDCILKWTCIWTKRNLLEFGIVLRVVEIDDIATHEDQQIFAKGIVGNGAG